MDGKNYIPDIDPDAPLTKSWASNLTPSGAIRRHKTSLNTKPHSWGAVV
jgi:hypothetical protein